MERKKCNTQRGYLGKILSPAAKREVYKEVKNKLDVSERRVCRALKLTRSTATYKPVYRDEETKLEKATKEEKIMA